MPNKKNDDNAQSATTGKQQFLRLGGIYFHRAGIINRKNVFVTEEYIALLLNAFKYVELKRDIKNLIYLVMPNFFYWVFKLSDRQNNPVLIYSEVKKVIALEIIKMLREEINAAPQPLARIFQNNIRVCRSEPKKILWTFEEKGKEFDKRYKVWEPKSPIRPVNDREELSAIVDLIKRQPVSERWQMVGRAEQYPYLYVAEDIDDVQFPAVADCGKIMPAAPETVAAIAAQNVAAAVSS